MDEKIAKSLLDGCKIALSEAVNEISRRITSVTKQYGVPFEAVRDYLEINEPSLFETIKKLHDELDNDIFSRLKAGIATKAESDAWRRCVQDWKYLYLEGINRYEQFQIVAEVA